VTVPENLPLALHPVDSTWVNQRARELADNRGLKRPDVKGALSEIVDKFVEQAGDNLDESRDLALYQPSTDTDPYIVAVPLVIAEKPETLDTVAPAVVADVLPTPGRPHEAPTTIQEEFENVLFESDVGASPMELEKDANGRYINSRIRLLWFGFNLYHQKMTQARRADFREPYHKPLGSYIIGKVFENGATVFTRSPTRLKTKALAFEEAHRLREENGEAWGVWRCIDIIGASDAPENREQDDADA